MYIVTAPTQATAATKGTHQLNAGAIVDGLDNDIGPSQLASSKRCRAKTTTHYAELLDAAVLTRCDRNL